MADGAVLEGLKFEQRHGKDRVRVGRVWRDPDGTHNFAEWNVSVSLLSDCIPAYVTGDNSAIVATDTMKNTVYVKAKESSERIPVEVFAINLAKHFTTFYEMVSSAIVNIAEKQWERVSTDDQPHKHGFKLGSEEHTTEVVVKKSGALRVASGIRTLRLLKTTQVLKDLYGTSILFCQKHGGDCWELKSLQHGDMPLNLFKVSLCRHFTS